MEVHTTNMRHILNGNYTDIEMWGKTTREAIVIKIKGATLKQPPLYRYRKGKRIYERQTAVFHPKKKR